MFCRHLIREHGMCRALRGCQTISSRTLSDTPTVLNQTISSVTEVTTLSGDIASVTSDIATSLPVSQISSVAEVVKVAVEQLPDLVWYNPTSYVIHGLDLLQTTTGLPWWATLVCCGVVSRTAMLPINIYAQRIRMKFLPVADQFKKNGDAIQAAHKSKDLLKIKILSKEKKYLKAKYGVGPFSMMKPLIGIGACTMTIFFSITKLTSMPYAPLLNTDFLWLSNLTVCDPYHAMAAFNGMLVAVLIKSGIDTGKSPIIDMFFSTPLRTISFITFMGVTQGYFSSALLTYWISSNLVGMLTVQLLKWERFRASVGLLSLKEMRVLEDKQPTLEQLMNDLSGAKSAVRKEGREEEMKRHREKAEELARQALQANEEYKQSLQRFERSKAGEESEEREDSQLDVEKGTADLRVNCKAPIGKLKEGKEEG